VDRALNASFSAEPHQTMRSEAHLLFGKLYSQHVFLRGRVYSGAAEMLVTLRSAGIALCCVTNKDSAFALPLLEATGLREYFSFILCADRIEDRKPSPKLLLAACSRLNVSPDEVLYVGDSQTDIFMAQAAGSRVVVVDYGYNHGLPFDDPKPDAIVSHLSEIVTMCNAPIIPNAAGRTAVSRETS
jgi:phosphoglycolate phosphatase